MATNVGNAYMGGANAQAAGGIAGANAVNQGLSSYLNYSSNNSLIKALGNRNQSPTPTYYSAGNTYDSYDYQ